MTPLPQNPVIAAIAGGSCSGKTTLARRIASHLGEESCLLISQDSYYFDIREIAEPGTLPNFDAPSSIDFKTLTEDLSTLKSGQAVQMPVYNFSNHQRESRFEPAAPRPLILIEGMLVLTHDGLRDILDHSVYMECPEDLRLERRLKRDIAERGRTRESVLEQFRDFVAPSHGRFVEPSKHFADRIIPQAEYLKDIDKLARSLINAWIEGRA